MMVTKMPRSVCVLVLILCLVSAICVEVGSTGAPVLHRLKERVTAAHAESDRALPKSLLSMFTAISASAPTPQALVDFKAFRATTDGVFGAPLLPSVLDTIIGTTCTDQHLTDLQTHLRQWNNVRKGNQGWPHMFEYQFVNEKDGLTRLRDLAKALTAFVFAGGDVNSIASVNKHGTDLAAVLDAFDVVRLEVDANLLLQAQPRLEAAEAKKIADDTEKHLKLETELAAFQKLKPTDPTYAAEAPKHAYHPAKVAAALKMRNAAIDAKVARGVKPLVEVTNTNLARLADYEALNLKAGTEASCRQLVAIAKHVTEGLMQAVQISRAKVPPTTCTYRCYRRTIQDKKPRNNPEQACDFSVQTGNDVEDENLWLSSGGTGGLLIMLSNGKLATFINQGLESTLLGDDRDANLIPADLSWANVWKAGNAYVVKQRQLSSAFNVVAQKDVIMKAAVDSVVATTVAALKKKDGSHPADVVVYTDAMTKALLRTRWNTCKAFA